MGFPGKEAKMAPTWKRLATKKKKRQKWRQPGGPAGKLSEPEPKLVAAAPGTNPINLGPMLRFFT
jgi:hypothetical protein